MPRLCRIAFGFLIILAAGLAGAQAAPASASGHGGAAIPVESEEAIRRMQYPEAYPPVLLLPDLRTLPPTDLLLQILRGQGVTRLRFTNTIWNAGPGPLEMRASTAEKPGLVSVDQVVLRADGEIETRSAGLFEFHETHEHWHWDGFSVYEVWSVSQHGALVELLRTSGKVGYCLLDLDPYPGADAPPFPEGVSPPMGPQYDGCDWGRQGISAGWIDSYETQIDGQFVLVTGLPDGVYALRTAVDPQNIIRESVEGNNAAVLYFRLEGETVEAVGETFRSPDGDSLNQSQAR